MQPRFDEFASIKDGRDITRGWVNAIGNYLPSQDGLLALKSGGDLELYEQVAQDDQVKSCLQQRFRAITAYPWEVIPGGNKKIDRLAAESLEWQLKQLKWDSCNEKMLWGMLFGYSVAEIIWERRDGKIIIADIRVRDPRRFAFDIDRQLLLKTTCNPLGEVVPDKKFWHFAVGAKHDDEPYGRGLGHWLYWPTFFKRNGVRWWLRFLELFASPARKGSYPKGATQQEKDILWQAMRAFGQDDSIMMPEGMVVEFLETSRNGATDYQSFVERMDGAIAKIILSQTMTTDSGSSLSQAEVHENVALSIVESDAELLCESFNDSVARWLTDWNFPGAAYPQVRRNLKGEADLKALADRDKVLFDMGFPPNLEYVVETYGDGFKQEATEASPVALNSAQLGSFVQLITSAQQSGWSKEMVRTSLEIAFPHVSDALLDEMAASFEQQGAGAGADPAPAPADINMDDVASMFARIPEGTIKGDYVLKDSRWQRIDPPPAPPAPPRPHQPLLAKPIQPRRLKPEAFSNSDREDFEGMMRDWEQIKGWSKDVESAFEKGIDASRIMDGYTFAKNATGKDLRGIKAEGRIQAAAKVKDEGDALHIAGLGSAPWNNGLNDERSIRGAGKAMVASIIQESMDAGYGGKVTLEDTEESRPFYDAIGFDYGKKHPGHRYLTPEAASKFMAAYRGNAPAFSRSDFDWMDYIDLLEAIGGCNIPDRDPDAAFAAPKKKNCVKGISCGNTCISASKSCKKPLSPKQKAAKPPIVATAKPVRQDPANPAPTDPASQPAPATEPSPEPATAPTAKADVPAEESATADPAKVNQSNLNAASAEESATVDPVKINREREALKPQFRPLLDMANGADPDGVKISDEDIKYARTNFMEEAGQSNIDSKTSRMKSEVPSLSDDEALALATWIGGKYRPMNSILYGGELGDEDEKAVETTTILAAKALHKIPPVTQAQIEREAEKKGADFDPSEPFGRYLEIDNPAEFVKRYQDALTGNGIIRESTHFATTHISREDFSFCDFNTNIAYEVEPKLDGTGNGRYIDHYKNQMSEGEVIYPPQTKFKVVSVTPPSGKPTIESVLPAEEAETLNKHLLLVKLEMQILYSGTGPTSKAFKTKLGKAYKKQFGEDLPSDSELESMRLQGKDLEGKYADAIQESLKGGRSPVNNWIIKLKEI